MTGTPYYGSNDGNSINRNIMRGDGNVDNNSNKKKKNVTINLSMDTKEAIRSLKDLERQVNKLGDMADQGQRRQGGFLSSKQVQMYKQIMKEIEQSYQTHLKNMQKMEQQYQSAKSAPAGQTLKQLQDELKKREQLLKNAEGGNKWGDVASPIIQEYHRNKHQQAQQSLKDFQNTDEYKDYRSNVQTSRSNLETMRSTVSQIEQERTRSELHSTRINDMYERNPNARRYANGIGHLAARAGAVTSFHGYLNYTENGIDILRQQERMANNVALSTGYSTGDRRSDATLRDLNAKLGEQTNYDAGQTAALESVVASGGTDGNVRKLASDTQAAQVFGRSYGLDPSEFASAGSTLQKMGSFSEGEQQRFASILAGAIAKEGMSGRQQEMIQSVVTLAQNVSQGQAQFTQQQFSNTLGLQVALGQAVPSLKGDRGTQLLSNMDAAIKGGGQGLDLLMGKGTKYTGLSGMYKLQMQQEQGLSNPQNLVDVLQGAKRLFGNFDTNKNAHDMTGFALKEQLGLPLNEYEALSKSGLLDKIMSDPGSISSQDLSKAGASTLAKQWNQYQNSQTARVDSNQARATNVQARNAKAANEASTASKGFFYGLGDYADIGLITASGLGMGLMSNRLGNFAGNAINQFMAGGTIGGGGGSVAARAGGLLRSARGGIGSAARSIGSRIGGSGLATFASDALEATSPFMRAMPIVGSVADVAGDRLTNPQHSWGRSIAKGVGSAIGTGLGILASGAVDVGTGGIGAVTNVGLTAGGAYLGDKAGDWLYSLFNGTSDEQTKTKVPGSGSASPAQQANAGSGKVKVGDMAVQNLNINDKKLADVVKGGSTPGSGNGQQTIHIIIEGNIQGMNDQNQNQVKDSIVSYLESGGLSNFYKYNISSDQTRG